MRMGTTMDSATDVMDKIAEDMRRELPVADKTYHLRTYKQVFWDRCRSGSCRMGMPAIERGDSHRKHPHGQEYF